MPAETEWLDIEVLTTENTPKSKGAKKKPCNHSLEYPCGKEARPDWEVGWPGCRAGVRYHVDTKMLDSNHSMVVITHHETWKWKRPIKSSSNASASTECSSQRIFLKTPLEMHFEDQVILPTFWRAQSIYLQYPIAVMKLNFGLKSIVPYPMRPRYQVFIKDQS